MLILNRRRGEAIVLDGDIRLVVLQCGRHSVRIGIEAPRETGIQREELLSKASAEDSSAS